MNVYIPLAFTWTIYLACAITATAAVMALVSKNYDDTMTECVGLAMIALASVILILQVHTYSFAMASGVAFMCASIAVLAVALVIKRMRQYEAHHARRHRSGDRNHA